MGALLLLLAIVVTTFGMQALHDPSWRSFAVLLFAVAGTSVTLGLGLIRLTAWGYWLTLVLLAIDVGLSIGRGFPGGEAEIFRFGFDVVLLWYLAPKFRAFMSPPDEAPRPRPSRLASLLGVGSTSLDWARLAVFAGSWLAMRLVLHLGHGGFPAMNGLLAMILDVVFLVATLAIMLRWVGREILATVLTALLVTLLHLLTLWLLVFEDYADPPRVPLWSVAQYTADVLVRIGALAMMLHVLRSEWVGVLVGSLGGSVAFLTAQYWWISSNPYILRAISWPSVVASVLAFTAVLTLGTILLRRPEPAAEPGSRSAAGE